MSLGLLARKGYRMYLSENDSCMWHKSDETQTVPIHLIRNSYHFLAHTCDSRQEALALNRKFKIAPVVADGNVTNAPPAVDSRVMQPSSSSASSVGVPPGSGLESHAAAPAIPVDQVRWPMQSNEAFLLT